MAPSSRSRALPFTATNEKLWMLLQIGLNLLKFYFIHLALHMQV
jgi:hypothetical protein